MIWGYEDGGYMFLLMSIGLQAWAQEPEQKMEDELVISSKGRLIILKADKTWEEVPAERSACHSKVEKGHTDQDGYSFTTQGDIFLSKGKTFSYFVRSYPDKSEDLHFELYRSKSTFKGHFDIVFHNYHVFRKLEINLVKVPYRGWSFQFTKDLNASLVTDLRTKHIKSFETHKHTYYHIADMSAKEFRSNIQCLHDAISSYLNTPQSLANKEKYQREEAERVKAAQALKAKEEEEKRKKEEKKKKKKKPKKKKGKKQEEPPATDAPPNEGTPL